MKETFEWEKVITSQTFKDIKNEWKILLSNPDLKEKDYHSFIQQHPYLFLCLSDSYMVVSKLKLGSDYETDFVVIEEGYSDGTIYEIVEIETPHTRLFDNNGNPTSRFNTALQQIRDWKRWIASHQLERKKIFPSVNAMGSAINRIRYKIIIGQRTTNTDEIEKRQQIADTEGVQIWSFDRLTELVEQRRDFFNVAKIAAGQFNSVPYQLQNELANPFYICITDSQWRQICRKGTHHIYTSLISEIVGLRKYNEYFDKWKEEMKIGLSIT